jgi:predicted Zn-dependent peptidase
LDPKEFALEKNVILEEIKRRDDEPEDLVHDVFSETLWPTHVLGKSVIGEPDTVSALKPSDLRDYMGARYTPDVIMVAAAGNLNHNEIVAMVAERFSDIHGFKDRWRAPNTTPEFSPGFTYIDKPIEQVNMVMGVPAFSQMSEERYKMSILDNIVGGSMSSRLFQEIREKRGLAYSVGSYTQSYAEGGYFAIYSGASPENSEQVVDIIKKELNDICRNNISAKELLRAKNQFRGGIVMGQESMNSRMMRIGRNELIYDRVIPIDEMMDRINAVTLDDIAEIAEQLFAAGQFATAVVGPSKKKNRKKK